MTRWAECRKELWRFFGHRICIYGISVQAIINSINKDQQRRFHKISDFDKFGILRQDFEMADKNRSKARSLSNPGSAGAMNQYQAPNGSGGGLFRSTDDLHYDVHKYLDQFWQYQTEKIEKMSPVSLRKFLISRFLRGLI